MKFCGNHKWRWAIALPDTLSTFLLRLFRSLLSLLSLSASLSLICLCYSPPPLVEHSLNCMSNCIIKIPIKRGPEIGSVSPKPTSTPPATATLTRWAEVNRKITAEHDKRQCYQRNLINTAPCHSTPPTCNSPSTLLSLPLFPLIRPSFSHFPHTLCVLCKHSTILQNSTCENSTRNANENEASKRI